MQPLHALKTPFFVSYLTIVNTGIGTTCRVWHWTDFRSIFRRCFASSHLHVCRHSEHDSEEAGGKLLRLLDDNPAAEKHSESQVLQRNSSARTRERAPATRLGVSDGFGPQRAGRGLRLTI